jgi:CheY-like chemotaxis protein
MKIRENKRLGGMKVLVAENNLVNREFHAHLLKSWGVEVDIALDGNSAIELVSRNKYDLIIIEIHLPGIDGYNTTREIRQKEGEYYRNLPIFTILGMPDESKIKECGMSGYLKFPVHSSDLFDLVKGFSNSRY